MSKIEANKALVKGYFRAIDDGDLPAFDVIVATDFQERARGREPGREALKEAVRSLRVALPDMSSTVTHIVAEGDLVAVRNRVRGTHLGPLADLPATGNRVDFTALQLFRVDDALIVEHWEIFDETTLRQQLEG
jgi:predicted ester cyclase